MKTNHCALKIQENLKSSMTEINVPHCVIPNQEALTSQPCNRADLGSVVI